MIDDKSTRLILTALDDDNMITLDDKSKWEVDSGSLSTASTWLPSSRVTVRLVNEESKYQYEITRIVHGDSIKVRKVT